MKTNIKEKLLCPVCGVEHEIVNLGNSYIFRSNMVNCCPFSCLTFDSPEEAKFVYRVVCERGNKKNKEYHTLANIPLQFHKFIESLHDDIGPISKTEFKQTLIELIKTLV